MTWVDDSDLYYKSPVEQGDGSIKFEVIYLGAPVGEDGPVSGPLPAVKFLIASRGALSKVQVLTEDPADMDVFDWDTAGWQIDPPNRGWGPTRLTGHSIQFRHNDNSKGRTNVRVSVRTRDTGERVSVSADVITQSAGTRQKKDDHSVSAMAYTHGEPVLVESLFGFDQKYDSLTFELIELSTTDNPRHIDMGGGGFAFAEASYDETKSVVRDSITMPWTDPALKQRLSFTYTPELRPEGHGVDFIIKVTLPDGQTCRSMILPVWCHGTNDGYQDINNVPHLTFPRWATQPATDLPDVADTPEEMTKWGTRWHTEWSRRTGTKDGAFTNYAQYNSVMWYVNLDDPDVPRVDVVYNDFQNLGFEKTAWRGEDRNSKPFPRSGVALQVPIPKYVFPAPGNDRSICIVGVRNGKVETIWEFWIAQKMADGSWRSAGMAKTSAEDEWRHSMGYTSSASGISNVGVVLRVPEAYELVNYVRQERKAGRSPDAKVCAAIVQHPMAIVISSPRADSASDFSFPATHTDGNIKKGTTQNGVYVPDVFDMPEMPREGQIAVIREDVDLDAANLTDLNYGIMAAAKYRGIIVVDRTGVEWGAIDTGNGAFAVENDSTYGYGNSALWDSLRGTKQEPGKDEPTPHSPNSRDGVILAKADWWQVKKVIADGPEYYSYAGRSGVVIPDPPA